MLITEPEILAFNNVRLNQAYSSSLCITNSADSSLEFTLRATSPRYSISPNRVRLDAGASAVVTVRLFVSQAHASAGTKADYLVLKCLYSEQRLPVSYTLYKKAPGGRSRSPSPAPSRPSRSPSRTPQAKSEIRPDGSPPAALRFMQSTSSSRGRSPPPSPPPDRHAPQDEQYVPRSEYARVCSAWEDERLMFEQRSEKVMRVLDKKDGLIRDLRAQLAGSGIRGELERQMQAPAEDAAGLDATRAEMAGMRERLIDQSEQIEVLISEIARLRNELTDSVPAAAPAFLAPQIRQDVAPLPASPLPATTDPFPTDALKRRISELEADLYSARFKAEASDREMEELMNRNAYLEGECTALSGQLQRAEETWRQAASEAPLPFPHAATRPDLDTSTSVGPEVLALYQERAHRAETDNGILLGHIAQLEREHAEAEARADVLSRRLGDQQELCAQLSDRCAELETIAEVARPTPKEEPVRQDPEPASRGPDVSVDSDGTELREANVWWSYVWHAMGESDGARLEREHDAAVAVLTASDRNADSQMVGSNSLNYYTDAIARLQRTVNELKSTTSAQVVEIAVARQNLLSNRLKHRGEMDAMREELDLSRRELGRVVGREKAHRGDGEIKIAELANTVRMLAGKSDAHAVAAAARQDLLAEQLTVHHLRADVEAYRSLLDAEQARITSLKRDLETSKSLLDASGVVETILHVPGVSAQKVIETFAVKIFKLEHRLAASQDECGKIKLKIGDGFALRDVPSGVPVGVGRGPHLGGLLGSTSRAKVINLDIKSKRGRSVSPISTRLGRPGMAIAERANREGSVECISGAEFRVRSNLVGGDAEDGEIYSPPSLTCSPADSAGAAAHIWEALAPCVQNQSPDSLVDSLNTALMARRLALQADQINTLEEKVSILETEKTDILEKRLRQEVDENDRTRIDLDTCNRRLELSESTQRLALEDLRRARERILELEKDAIHRRLFGQPAAAVEGAGCSNAVAGKSGRYYECMTDSDEDGDKSPQDTDHSMNTSSDSDAVDREQQRRLVQRLKVCERELHQNKDLLRERTLQLKILMQTVEAVQHSSVEEERYGDAECRLGLEDIARAPIGTIGQTQSGGRSDGVSRLDALIKRVVELTTELSSQTAATGLLEQRVNELEAEKRKTVTRQNALKANSLVVSDELARLEAENLSLKQRIKDIEYAALEKSASGEKEVERLLTALRESEAELEAVKISLENLSRQIDATDHRAFMRWMEDVVLNDEHQLSGPAGTLSKRRNSSPTAEEIDIGRDPSAARDSAEVDSDTASSVKSLVVSLLVQWREQVGFYPRGANGPITKSEQRFLQRVSDLVLAANERCERAVLSARCAEEERLAAEQRCELMRTRLGLCAQQLHRYLRRTDFSERVISVERKHIIRANERLMSLYRNNHVEVMTHDQNMTRNLYEEQSKCNAIKVEKDVLSNKCRQLQCRVAELESQVGGAMGVRVREQATAALQSRVQTVEDTLHKWFKAELPRLLSGLPINEDDISMRNMFTDGDVLMYPLYSSVAASSDFMIHSQSRSYAMAQALCSSKAVQAAAELRAAGLVERNSVLKDRILELEGVIMRWRRSIEEQPSVLPDILNGRSDNAFASGMTSERVDIALVQHELATIRTKHLESEERATRLSAQLEQCQERSEAMRKLAEHLRREEREERTFTAHQLAQLRLSLEEQHANELKELRKSYEAEKASLGEELAMVADAIRREVNDDSGERRDGGRSDSYDEVICSARMDQAIPSRIDQLDAQREADIQRRRIDLLQSLNADTLPSRAAPAADLLSSSSSTQEADAASTISSDAPESIAVPNVERSSAYPGRSKTFLKPKKSVRVEVLTKELTETTRHLSSLQRSYGTAQHQIMELEQLLESQRVAFQLSRAEQPSPRTNSNQDQKSRRSPTVETSVQTDSAGIQINRETSSSVDLIGPSKSMPTVELLTSEIKQQLKSMYLRHYAWMQALETAAYLHSDAGIDTVVSKADASMIASEFSSQIRILISMVDKMKMTVDKEVFDSCAEGTPLTTATALDGGVGAELRRLIGRVRDVENVLIDERSIPEQHLLALRELRARCSGMEQLYSEEMSHMQRDWNEERELLNRQIKNMEAALEECREESSRQATLLRNRYECALQEVQDSMELQTTSTGEQLSQLHDVLNSERAKFMKLMMEREITQNTENEKDDHGESAVDELARLKKMLSTADSELHESRVKLQGLQSHHNIEMDGLREHFRKYRQAQQEVVAALETQLNELTHGDNDMEDLSDLGADNTYASYNQEFGAGVSLQDAQIQMNRLAAKHRLRRLELNAILKAISSAGASVSSDHSSGFSLPSINIPTGHPGAHPGQLVTASGTKDVDTWSLGQATRILPLREELLEARLIAADREVESLLEMLDRERRACAALRAQLGDVTITAGDAVLDGGKSQPDSEFSLPISFMNSLSDGDKNIAVRFARRVNNFRRSSRSQIVQLKKELNTIKDNQNRDNSDKQKLNVAELRAEISTLRDENARKAKLLATFKATRSADFNAIEQWRNEASDMEDKIKHLKASVASKESIIKDLKVRLNAVESAAEDPKMGYTDGGDYSLLSAAELKNRLKASDLEAKRSKMRLAAFREKVVDLERLVEPLKAENERLSQCAERLEALKSAISRKDSLLKNYKEQAERTKADFDALKEVSETRRLDLERKIKMLRKQLDDSAEALVLLQRESSLAKKRLLSAAEAAARGSRASNSSLQRAVESVPVGSYIDPHEAALPSALPKRSASNSSTGYQASTISHSNKLRSSMDVSVDISPRSPSLERQLQAEKSPQSDGDASFVSSGKLQSLRAEEVPEAVDIPLSELNDILQAIGGMKSSRPQPAFDNKSKRSDDWVISAPPGAAPIGPSFVSSHMDSSSESSSLSVERRLQQLVDAALLPEPRVPPPPAGSRYELGSILDFASLSDETHQSTTGTRISVKRKSSNNL